MKRIAILSFLICASAMAATIQEEEFFSEGVHLAESIISTTGTEMTLLDEATNVKVLLDGVAINPLNAFNKSLSINSIPVSNIERIEIAPGGGAVLYGNGVSGGVVNIITKGNTKNGGYLESDYSSYNSKRLAAGGNYNINDKLSFGVNYSGQNNHRYRREEKL